MKGGRTRVRAWVRLLSLSFPLLCAWVVLAYILVRTTSPLPESVSERKAAALTHLWGLRREVRQRNAAQRMQQVFPEGGCFTITLYGLAWTNLVSHFDVDSERRGLAIQESLWALDQYGQPYVVGPFTATQVRNGVFWLGQRNLLIGQLLAVMPEASRPAALVREFHDNSRSLAQAFLASPTAHLDSYPRLCWPADNVTALASLLIHDELYAT